VEYDRAPWWAYMYWSYVYLGLVFVIGILVAIFFSLYRLIKRENIEIGQSLLFLYTFVPFILLSALSQRSSVYFIVLFPLFAIFAVINIANIISRLIFTLKNQSIKDGSKWISSIVCAFILLVPGPFMMTLENPHLGTNSRYDIAGDWVTEFTKSSASETIFIIAYDRFALRFYLSDEILDRTQVIPLFSDNYSVDALGHENMYYPESILYNMTVLGTIDLLVDEIRFEDDTQSTVRNYFRAHASRVEIENELVIYIL
jgi:hypothetical protein